MDAYNKTHPNPDRENKTSQLITKARIALAGVLDVANAVGDVDQAKLDDAFKLFEAAYNELTAFVASHGRPRPVRAACAPRPTS